jgi:neutral ceramidase
MTVIGVATEDITPPVGIRLSGYAGRPFGNIGVLEPLRTDALYLSSGGTQAVIVTLDVIGLSGRDDTTLRQRIGEALQISPDAIIIACSHTHSGPATQWIRATGQKEVGWTREVLDRAVRVAHAAQTAAQTIGSASVGEAPCFAAMNRRTPDPVGGPSEDGSTDTGPMDPACHVLRFFGHDGKPVAALFQYSMHPVSLTRENRYLSPDWVGAAREGMETAWHCPALFLPGCCGDINPRVQKAFVPPHSDEEKRRIHCRNLGEKVAEAAITAAQTETPLSFPLEIGFGAAPAALPLQPLVSAEVLDKTEQDAREALRKRDTPLPTRQLSQGMLSWVSACRRRKEGSEFLPSRVSALRIGSVTLIALPGEIFTEIGQQIREKIPNAWPIGYANGNPGYLFPDSVQEENGYETEIAFRLYGRQAAGRGTGAALVRASVNATSKI